MGLHGSARGQQLSRVLVTGASGFVGGALVTKLLADGVVTRAGVRRCTDLPKLVEIVNGVDLATEADWTPALHGCDVVIHAAARAHILNDTADSLALYRRINTQGTLRLARQAARSGVRRFVFISSAGVHGNVGTRAFTEDDPPAPAEHYAVSKLEAEQGLRQLAAETGLEVVIIRPPLVYGPGVPGNFRRLLDAMARGIPLPLGAVHNRRSLLGLDNLVDFVMTCARHPAAANETFLVSDGQDLSTTELLDSTARALSCHARLVPVPAGLLNVAAVLLGQRDAARRLLGSLQLDISKSKRVLGWTPMTSPAEQLRKTAQWYLMRDCTSATLRL